MAAQEEDPSIEEILASIRQIISDDEEEAAPSQERSEAPKKAEKKSEPAPEPEAEEDILDLNDMVDVDDEDDDFVIGDDDMGDEDDAFPEPNFDVDDEDEVEEVVAATEDDIDLELMDHIVADEEDFDVSEDNSEIISDRAAEEAVGALSKLAQNVALSNRSADVTLEDIVKELVRPMLRQWINENMSDIVEALVEKELEKLVRQARNK